MEVLTPVKNYTLLALANSCQLHTHSDHALLVDTKAYKELFSPQQ